MHFLAVDFLQKLFLKMLLPSSPVLVLPFVCSARLVFCIVVVLTNDELEDEAT